MKTLKSIVHAILSILIVKILFINIFGVRLDDIYAKYVTSSFIGKYHLDLIGVIAVGAFLLVRNRRIQNK